MAVVIMAFGRILLGTSESIGSRRDAGREVHDRVAAVDRGRHRAEVEEVADDGLGPELPERLAALGAPREADDLVATLAQEAQRLLSRSTTA